MKSPSIPWTRKLFYGNCPCGSGSKSYKCCWRGDGAWEKAPVGAIVLPKTSNPPLLNERCYLSSYGDCSTKITREHFISRTILEKITTSRLTIRDAPHFFGGKNHVEIGIDDFVAKVLCDVHNPLLGDLDAALGIAFSNMDALAKEMLRPPRPNELVRFFRISSGLDIERWMIKVYCGMVAAGRIRGISGKIVQRSAVPLVFFDALVGVNDLPSPLGLYYHAFTGQTRNLDPMISIGTVQLTDGSGDVGGLLLSMGPMNFVLVTSMESDDRLKSRIGTVTLSSCLT